MTTQVSGETIPSDQPGTLAMGLRQPAGVCVGMAPWNAPVILGVRAIAVPLAVGNTVVLKASELSPATHRLIVDAFVEAGLPAGVGELHQPCGGRRTGRGRGADLASGHQARELHRLLARGPHHRRALGQVPEALPAGTGRQGAAAGAGRCRPRRGRGGRRLRRLHAPGPDLHVHRAHHRGGPGVRRVPEEVRRQGEEPAGGRPDQGQLPDRRLRGREDRRSREGADRRRHRQGRARCSPAARAAAARSSNPP